MHKNLVKPLYCVNVAICGPRNWEIKNNNLRGEAENRNGGDEGGANAKRNGEDGNTEKFWSFKRNGMPNYYGREYNREPDAHFD